MTRLQDIPSASVPPPAARPSAVVARLRTVRPSRRVVLRGLVLGAVAAALVPLDWYLSRREAAAEGSSRGDLSEHMSCTPSQYTAKANNWPAGGPAVCYGGWRRGSYPCEGGYHLEGAHSRGDETLESTRLTTDCHGRNAWRWKGYRCSDAMTDVTFADGTEYHGVTIAACVLPEDQRERSSDGGLLPEIGS